MLSCPHCGFDVELRRLKHPSLFSNYRVCPNCENLFTVDPSTKKRQAIALPLAVISLAFTVLTYVRGPEWITPAIMSYVVLGGFIYWANRRVRLVRYERNA